MNASTETAVVCDSTAYLPPDLAAERGIGIVSLYVSIDGVQEREVDIADYPGFFERLRASEGGATTSQPSIGDFIEVYKPLLAGGREVISIHISAGISGTVDAANQARQRLQEEGKGGERIHIFDTQSACGVIGLCALAAQAALAAGEGVEGALARATQTREAMKSWFAIDTLEYLRRGGRIGGASAWIGSALKIKPILTMDGEIKPVERVRTRARSLERLHEYALQLQKNGADGWVVQHIQDSETAAKMVADCTEIFGCGPAFVSEIGPVIGSHVGPGLIGVGGIPARLITP